MEPSVRLVLVLLCFLVLPSVVSADTNANDSRGLRAMMNSWDKQLASWSGNNPCGQSWTGIACTGNRVTSIKLGNLDLSGTLSGDIQFLQELQHLDLSYNMGLHGSLPSSIGALSNLQYLILVGCSFSGEIPKELGQLTKLHSLSLNNNKFQGSIPPSLGGIPDLYWLDLANNLLTGELPVFNGIDTGLDNLTDAQHFHLSANNLSGSIPIQIFKPEMKLIHLLLDNNQFSGSIPPTLGLLDKLQVLRLDSNHQLTGPIPDSICNLTYLVELYLENNNFTGPLPDLTGIQSLVYVDMSNNSFDNSVNESNAPAWFTALPSLTSLFLENLHIPGQLPQSLFNLSGIQTLRLRGNNFSGILEIGPPFSPELQLIDLQDNQITGYTRVSPNYDKTLILVGNPVCDHGNNEPYCTPTGQSTNNPAPRPYTTAKNCSDDQQLSTTCLLPNQDLSPSCNCGVPYKGTLFLRSPPFSDTSNASYKYFNQLEQDMKGKFRDHDVPVDSVSIKDPHFNAVNNMEMSLEVFPSGKIQFSARDISELAFLLSSQTYKPPTVFGPYYFIGLPGYPLPDEFLPTSEPKASHKTLIIGVSIGSAVLACAIFLALLVIFRVVPVRTKKQPTQTESLASWEINSTASATSIVPQLHGVRMFTFEELKKITGNFSEANDIGKGGYGKVYRGTMPNGQLVAVKRSQQWSLQGSLEFRTEIELLSRVHHKNVVSLVGFCLDQGEQMLVYEYVANGTLKESLTGISGVRLDWRRRLRVLLGAAKGISYLHELADPPIVHRDIKSSNVLLDDRLNAKGYLDPEYYMTQQLTEKSDVYSFGVLMLEVITARKPLERGRYIVRVVKAALDRTKDLYGLHELLDPALVVTSPSGIAGLELFVDLALRCVEEAGADRPSMAKAVGEIERVLKAAAGADSASNSMSSYNSRRPRHPYSGDSPSEWSTGGMPSTRVEPK